MNEIQNDAICEKCLGIESEVLLGVIPPELDRLCVSLFVGSRMVCYFEIYPIDHQSVRQNALEIAKKIKSEKAGIYRVMNGEGWRGSKLVVSENLSSVEFNIFRKALGEILRGESEELVL